MAVTEYQQLVAHRCLAAGSLDGRVALEAQRPGVQAELANLHQADRGVVYLVRTLDQLVACLDQNQDQLADVAQTLDQLVHRGRSDESAARFLVGG